MPLELCLLTMHLEPRKRGNRANVNTWPSPGKGLLWSPSKEHAKLFIWKFSVLTDSVQADCSAMFGINPSLLLQVSLDFYYHGHRC